MEPLILKKSDLPGLLNAIREKMDLYLPKAEKRIVTFSKTEKPVGDDICRDLINQTPTYKNTRLSIKDFFFQPCEVLFEVKMGEEISIEDRKPERKPRAFFGVRACDARALAILDKVFTWDYQDTLYLEARDKSILIGLGCVDPCNTCFCTSLDIEPVSGSDVDINFIDLGENYFVEATTEKGEKLVRDITLLTEVKDEDNETAEAKAKESREKITRFIDAKKAVKVLEGNFEDDYWEEVARKCIDCGICTFLCPTCHCFDILDESTRVKAKRCRFWDACSFPQFTKMPMENPREERFQRYRQRIRHKYRYYVDNFEVIACVGCGRCIEFCPVNLDITRTLNEMPELKSDKVIG